MIIVFRTSGASVRLKGQMHQDELKMVGWDVPTNANCFSIWHLSPEKPLSIIYNPIGTSTLSLFFPSGYLIILLRIDWVKRKAAEPIIIPKSSFQPTPSFSYLALARLFNSFFFPPHVK